MTLAFFACAVVAALVAAHFAREERTAVVRIGWVVAVNWLLFASYWIYAPASPAYIIYNAGMAYGVEIPVTLADTWAAVDLISFVLVVFIGRNLWWSAMFWSIYLCMLTMHAVAYINDLQYLEYRNVLDAGLIIQLALLFVLGGDGLADYLSRCRDRIRLLGGSTCASSSTATAMEAQK